MHARSSLLWLMPALVACLPVAAPTLYTPIVAACAPDRIGHVTIEGAPRSALAGLTVLEGTHDDPARTERITEIATEALRASGYAHAAIAVKRELHCGMDLAVTVTLGQRFRIARIEFDTDDAFPPEQRLVLIEDALGTVNTIGGTYIEYRLRRALPELRRRYEDAGWLQAKIDPPKASYDENGVVMITIPVHSGARFKIGSIRAIGTNATTRTTVIDALGVRPGDYYDRASIRNGLERARKQTDRWIDLHVEVSSDRAEIDVDAIVEGR